MNRASLSGIAVDIGGTKIAVARIESGEVIQKEQQDTDATESIDSMLDRLCEMVNHISVGQPKQIGFAVTGRVDKQGHWYAVNTDTLTSVKSVPLASILGARLGQPVCVLNDALAGAVAEFHFGAGVDADRLAYITVSTGVGAGFVFNGLPLQSPSGLAGHIGFTSSRYSDRVCGSGRKGTLESVASGAAIARAAYEQNNAAISTTAVFAAAQNSEIWASKIIDRSTQAIAESIADLVALLDIDKVAIGGSVGLAPGYIEQVNQAQQRHPELFRVPVVRSQLANGVLLGALAFSGVGPA